MKQRRQSGYQVQAKNAEDIRKRKQESDAFVFATKRWKDEKVKPQFKRQTAQSIVDEVNEARGTSISERTVRQYVAEGNTGVPYLG